jgi:NodT family efflux transporter outer membrane factor (OMF) lipoprotein
MTVYRIRGLAMLMAGSATLTACASIPDLPPPAQVRDPAQIASSASLADDSSEWPVAGWWNAYGDPQLGVLMEEAIVGSPDLHAAAARLRTAQGYAQQAGAALLPKVDVSASGGLVQQSENNGIPPALVPNGWQDSGKAGFGFSLDLDLWGKNRAALAAAKADALAARYEVEAAKLALTTSLAATWAELARLHAQRDVLDATVENRAGSLRIVTQRVEADLDNRVALSQAKSRLSLARAELTATDEAIALTRNAIAALVGQGPDRAQTIAAPKVSLATVRGVPASASIGLIGRRPDIAAARAGVEASASRIKVARAAFYPDVSLSGLIGLQSLGFGNLFKAGSAHGNVGPAVTLPIFHGGALSGQYHGARGQYDEAVARYDGIVLQALREVADTLVSRKMLALRVAASRDALIHADEAHALARTRYASGLSSYLDVLSTEDGVLQARRNLADLETRTFTLDVSMVRALGGGFATT